MNYDVLCERVSRSCVVYGLVDSADRVFVRYVGSTCDAVARYSSHHNKGASLDVSCWIQDIRAQGRWPVMVLLEHCHDRAHMIGREKVWIRRLRAQQQADLNRRHTEYAI